MTGYEKIMGMTIEELSETRICPSEFGLKDNKQLCEIMDGGDYCFKCLYWALIDEVEDKND